MKRYVFSALFAAGLLAAAHGQIVTAEDFMAQVAEKYAAFGDYEASIAIRQGNTNMQGRVSHLKPQFLRIDFSAPANQVIVFNGETLTIYLPEYSVTLNQSVSGSRSGAAMASAAGLAALRRNYAPAYVSSPSAVPLEESGEMVVKLRLSPRSGGQTYREIQLAVNPSTLLVRRIEGVSFAGASVRFDFTNIKVDQGIPQARFVYDSPATSNNVNNFLFRDKKAN